MRIQVLQASNGSGWHYCPAEAPESFKQTLRYSDDDGFPTAEAAEADARRRYPEAAVVRVLSFHDLRPGDFVVVTTPHGERRGRVAPLLCNPGRGTVVLNAGGPHGTPVVCTPDNFLRAHPGKGR